MHPFSRLVFAAAALSLPSLTCAQAKVHITVDLDRQTIHVEAQNKVFDWKVSSGKEGYETPAGTYGVLWMDKDHHSDEYEQAYMPNAIFFAPGFAIHGFGKSPWGHKASHGCIRLPVAKSAILFDLVKAEGAEVKITGYSPTVAPTPESVAADRQRRDDPSDDGPVTYVPPGSRPDGDRRDGDRRDGGPQPAPARGSDSLFGSIY